LESIWLIKYYFVIYSGQRNITLSFPYRPSLRIQQKISAFFLVLWKNNLLWFYVLNDIRRSRKAEVHWRWLRKNTMCVQLAPWRWTPMIKIYVTILFKIGSLMYSKILESLIGVGLHLKLQLRRLFGLSEYHHFSISAVFEVSGARAKQSLCASSIILNTNVCDRSLLKILWM